MTGWELLTKIYWYISFELFDVRIFFEANKSHLLKSNRRSQLGKQLVRTSFMHDNLEPINLKTTFIAPWYRKLNIYRVCFNNWIMTSDLVSQIISWERDLHLPNTVKDCADSTQGTVFINTYYLCRTCLSCEIRAISRIMHKICYLLFVFIGYDHRFYPHPDPHPCFCIMQLKSTFE